MASVSLCSNHKDCKVKEYCKRFTATPNNMWDSVIEPRRKGDKCLSFLPNHKFEDSKHD